MKMESFSCSVCRGILGTWHIAIVVLLKKVCDPYLLSLHVDIQRIKVKFLNTNREYTKR